MATTRPEASETTGTLRETSGVTVPVTTNVEVVGCAVAAASGNCSGRSTVKSVGSAPGTMLAEGGASAAGSPCALLHPPRSSSAKMEIKTRLISRPLFFMSKVQFAAANMRTPLLELRNASFAAAGLHARHSHKRCFADEHRGRVEEQRRKRITIRRSCCISCIVISHQ